MVSLCPSISSNPAQANSTTSLEVAGFAVSWPEIMYLPTGCSLFEFKYVNNAPYEFLQVGFKLTDPYGDSVANDSLVGAPPGRSGIWDEQICAHSLKSGLGPYKMKIFIQDYSARGGGTLEKYADIFFTARPLAPNAPIKLIGSSSSTGVNYSFDTQIANPQITSYDIGIATLISPNLSPENMFSWGPKTIIKTSTTNSFNINQDDVNRYYASGNATPGSPSILITVRANNSLGASNWSNGVYSMVSQFGLQPFAKAKPPVVTSNKIKKITCTKGKSQKVVSGQNPKCPAGYKKKAQ